MKLKVRNDPHQPRSQTKASTRFQEQWEPMKLCNATIIENQATIDKIVESENEDATSVVHLVFQTYLEQNFEHLCKKTKFKNIFTTRKLKLVAKLESETDLKKICEIFFLKKNCC